MLMLHSFVRLFAAVYQVLQSVEVSSYQIGVLGPYDLLVDWHQIFVYSGSVVDLPF